MTQNLHEQRQRPEAMLQYMKSLGYLTVADFELFKNTINLNFLSKLEFIYKDKHPECDPTEEFDVFCIGIAIVASQYNRTGYTYLQQNIHLDDLLKYRERPLVWRISEEIADYDALLITILKTGLAYVNGEIVLTPKLSTQISAAHARTTSLVTDLTSYEEIVKIENQVEKSNGLPKFQSKILNDRVPHGYHRIESDFDCALSVLSKSMHTAALISNLIGLKTITLNYYLAKKPKFTAENCESIAKAIATIAEKLADNTLCRDDLNDLRTELEQYHSCPQFAQAAMRLIGTLLICIAALTAGIVAGVSAVALTATGAVGIGVGYALSNRFTLWANEKVYQENKDFVDPAHRFIAGVSLEL